MYVGNDFPDATPDESRRYAFDFSNDLDTSENIQSATWTIAVKSDSPNPDPNPSSHLIGAATNTGQESVQKIGGLLDGVVYVVACLVTSTLSAQVELFSHVRCKAAS